MYKGSSEVRWKETYGRVVRVDLRNWGEWVLSGWMKLRRVLTWILIRIWVLLSRSARTYRKKVSGRTKQARKLDKSTRFYGFLSSFLSNSRPLSTFRKISFEVFLFIYGRSRLQPILLTLEHQRSSTRSQWQGPYPILSWAGLSDSSSLSPLKSILREPLVESSATSSDPRK